jgi:hypothetical protein
MNATLCRLFSLAILAICCVCAVAQTPGPIAPCAVGVRAPAFGFWTWAANAHVKVYIRTADFTAEETPYLLTPLRNWDAAYEASGSGVRFEYQGDTREPMLCDNCLTIMRGKVFDRSRRHATELRAYSARRDQVITYASIVIDPTLTNPKAITSAIAHELGHNFGLLDCYTCRQKSTVMNQLKTMNVTNDMEGPTACDLAQVKEAYKELKAHPRPSPTLAGSSIPADEGEEPVDDDTPVVTPKPRRP